MTGHILNGKLKLKTSYKHSLIKQRKPKATCKVKTESKDLNAMSASLKYKSCINTIKQIQQLYSVLHLHLTQILWHFSGKKLSLLHKNIVY